MTEVIAAAWAVLKRLPWKQIGLALAVIALALVLWRAPWAEARGRAASVAKYQPVMDRATSRMALATRALNDADDAIKAQNASIKAHADSERKALAVAARLVAVADKRDVARRADIDRLRAAAARPIAGAPCASLSEVKDSWK